ncbi:toxin-antitoxin system TumE family protein [Sporosarcina sp. CAU 1771]
MSTGIPQTNFSLLEKEFHEIVEIRNGANGLPSKPGAIRKTILFSDSTKLSCQEIIKNGFIEYYNYDFYSPNGSIVMKFHSEPHSNSKAHQTSTEPFHLHVKKNEQDLEASLRLPNGRIRELWTIIETILMSKHLKYAHETPTIKSQSRKGRSSEK